MINKKNLSVIALITALTQGCANQPPVTIDAASLGMAARHVLSESVYFSTLFSSCIGLGGETELDTIDKQQSWINENSALVAAADSYYSQQQAERTFTHNNKTLAPNAIKLVVDARARAVKELSLAQRTPANQQKTCQFRLTQITSDNIALAKDPAIAPYQAELLTHTPLSASIADAPQLAGGYIAAVQGASYFNIAKAHESQCADAYTLGIINQWPNEIYSNFCNADAVEVVSCEWGKCTTKKL